MEKEIISSNSNHIVNMSNRKTININGVPFYLGKEGMFEFRDTPIRSLFFDQEEDLNSFIDYLYED